MFQSVNKAISWIVKIGGMIICAPVTWLVAGDLYSDVSTPAIRFLVQLSAVLVVEGVFLGNWLLLEFDRNAAPEIKTRYALTTAGMYFGLWVLAWQHGEGPAGLVFRAALGAALIGSGWDTYVLTWQKFTARTDKDINSSGRVKGQRRKLAIQDAVAEIKLEFELRADDRIKRRELARIERTQLQERLQIEAELGHKQQLQEIKADARQNSENAQYRSAEASDWRVPPEHARAGKAAKRDQRLELGRQILRSNPDLTGPLFLEQLNSALKAVYGARAKVSESTAYADFAVLRSELLEPASNGNGSSNGRH